MNEYLLAADNVDFRYPGRDTNTLHGITLALRRGERVGLVGESGAGKSTILRLLLGLDSPTSGAVRFQGEPLNLRDRAGLRGFRSAVQNVFQDPYGALDPRATVGRTITEPLRSLGIERDREALNSRVAELLAAVDLPADAADRYPHAFSGGQRQRIAIARALAPNPQLILADEPVSALDMSVRTQIIELLRGLGRSDAAVPDEHQTGLLLVSHDLSIVAALCDRVAVLQDGRIVEEGLTAEVLANPQHPYTRTLLAAIPRLPRIEG
ncbi:ABC transporter ATP-binding protein [Mycetocola lacteus]|uniref:ABC transporter ATP-binding protein n=1 Tax=Mycetocola lacteus TaxID=76637 RepID=A0A3L7AM51_9MICO|nr:ABC transporter ATP-binding protein [Mycetocola lacteus]RLP81367.1 ABC transporter ATP-binding protein [Mycetocola lacteus]